MVAGYCEEGLAERCEVVAEREHLTGSAVTVRRRHRQHPERVQQEVCLGAAGRRVGEVSREQDEIHVACRAGRRHGVRSPAVVARPR